MLMFGSFIFWAIIIGLAIWGVKRFAGNRREDRTIGEPPIEIAQKRLAHGEITHEEFEELKRDLQ